LLPIVTQLPRRSCWSGYRASHVIPDQPVEHAGGNANCGCETQKALFESAIVTLWLQVWREKVNMAPRPQDVNVDDSYAV
jgi:hypothetical protein